MVGVAFARISGLKPGAAPLARMQGEVALSAPFTRLPVLTPPGITASVPTRQVDHFTVTRRRD